jgi:hypothetical protein
MGIGHSAWNEDAGEQIHLAGTVVSVGDVSPLGMWRPQQSQTADSADMEGLGS